MGKKGVTEGERGCRGNIGLTPAFARPRRFGGFTGRRGDSRIRIRAKFQIISNPNNWAKIAKTNTEQSKLTPTKLYQFELWNKFKEFGQAHNQDLSFTKTNPQHWMCHVGLTVNTREKELACELYIPGGKELFDFLLTKKEVIEKELAIKLDWQRLPEETKASRIKVAKKFDVVGDADFSKYGEAFGWLEKKLINFRKVFPKYLSEYK
jgi:hypothetical protein